MYRFENKAKNVHESSTRPHFILYELLRHLSLVLEGRLQISHCYEHMNIRAEISLHINKQAT